jgi:hypothetical protein
MRKFVVTALVSAFVLTGAVAAWGAATGNGTLISVALGMGNTRDSGPNSATIRHDQRPANPADGQPQTARSIKITLRGVRLNSGIWRFSCSIQVVNQRGSDSSCPPNSRVGSGVVNLLAGGGGQIEETADIRLYVTPDGDLFIWLDSRPGEPVELNAAVPCEVTRRIIIVCSIPEALQMPAGVPSSIDDLRLKIAKVIRIRGRRVGILQNTGCRRAFVIVFEVRFRDGVRKSDSDRVRC